MGGLVCFFLSGATLIVDAQGAAQPFPLVTRGQHCHRQLPQKLFVPGLHCRLDVLLAMDCLMAALSSGDSISACLACGAMDACSVYPLHAILGRSDGGGTRSVLVRG